MPSLTIDAAREGPPGIANGGWLGGLLAEAAGTPWSGVVTLRKPTPVDTPLDLDAAGGTASLTVGGVELATLAPGGPNDDVGEPPPAVTWDTAVSVAPSYIGLVRHPFPGCLVCGTTRSPDDALCLRPGRLSPDVVAAPWRPAPWTDAGDGIVTPAAVWAALDCPSAWAIDDEGRSVVLGRMAVQITRLPAVGGRHVVVGWVRERTSRRIAQCGSALYDDDGAVLAVASCRWFEIPSQSAAGAVDRRES